MTIPRRAVQVWDEAAGDWRTVGGNYVVHAGRSVADLRVSTVVEA